MFYDTNYNFCNIKFLLKLRYESHIGPDEGINMSHGFDVLLGITGPMTAVDIDPN